LNHQEFVYAEIAKELDILFSTFDTKTLATAMMIRSAYALRACHSAGLWKVEDVRAVVEGATADIYEPLPVDQVPKIATTGGNGTVQ
jgi:hypothetical protein